MRQWVDWFEEEGQNRLLLALKKRADELELVLPCLIESNMQCWGDIQFVQVPAGEFVMGSKRSNALADSNECPQRKVDLTYDFWIGRFPITKEQFDIFQTEEGIFHTHVAGWKQKIDHPAVNVSWNDAQLFCK